MSNTGSPIETTQRRELGAPKLRVLLVLLALAVWLQADSLRRWRYERATTSELLALAHGQLQDVLLLKVTGTRLLSEGRSGEAYNLLMPAAQAHTDDAELTLLAGRAAWGQGEMLQASTLLHAALQESPDSADAHYWAAQFLYSRGRRDLAESLLWDVTRLDPRRGDAFASLGEFALNSDNLPVALELLDRAEKLTPTGATARLRATILKASGRLEEAEAAARTAVAREGSVANYTLLGEIIQSSPTEGARGEARLREAQENLRRAITLDSNAAEPLKLLAINYRTLGEHANAIRALRRMLRLVPSMTEGYLMLSQSYAATGQNRLSEQSLRIFRHLQPWQEAADAAGHRVLREQGAISALLQYARALLALGRNDVARGVLARAPAKDPQNGPVAALQQQAEEPSPRRALAR